MASAQSFCHMFHCTCKRNLQELLIAFQAECDEDVSFCISRMEVGNDGYGTAMDRR